MLGNAIRRAIINRKDYLLCLIYKPTSAKVC